MKRVVFGIVVILLTLAILTPASNGLVKSEPTLVVPDDYETIQEALNNADPGNTIYVKIGNYCENIVVNKSLSLVGEDRDATIIDGRKNGIVLSLITDNVTIENFTIINGHPDLYGIFVNSSDNNIKNNVVKENNRGIYLDRSSDNTISSNVLLDNVWGIFGEYSHSNTFEGNNLAENGGGVFMVESDHNVFNGNFVIKNNGYGILAYYGRYGTYTENILINNQIGIGSVHTSYDQIVRNNIVNNKRAIELSAYAFYSLVSENNVTENEDGVWLHGTYDVMVTHNIIVDNERGVIYYKLSFKENVICFNNIVNNSIGVFSNTTIGRLSKNNFINNSVQAYYEARAMDYWDESYPGGGNYWSDYTGIDLFSGLYQNETGSDGIGDTPYVIDELNRDYYPLMRPINKFDASIWDNTTCYIHITSNSTVSNFQLDETERIICFRVTGETDIGFCRIIIPNVLIQDLWHGNYTILLNREPWPFKNWTNNANTYLYFTYEHSEHEVIIIPEFPSFLILPIFIIATLLIVIIYRYYTQQVYNLNHEKLNN